MKRTLLFIFLVGYLGVYAQHGQKGTVLSLEDGTPLEFVSVYNGADRTFTNEDGRFRLVSQQDSVYFFLPGYQRLGTLLSSLKDTIFLKKNVVALDEVVVTNAKSILQRIKDSLAVNYQLSPHTETFFLRALLRRNDTMVRLQDMYGRVQRKTALYTGNLELEKKDFQVNLMQMRQLGITKDKDRVYFIFPSFYFIFKELVRINAMGPDFEVIEKPMESSQEIRVEFNNNKIDRPGGSSGHYIINAGDNAIRYFEAITQMPLPASLKGEKEYSHPTKMEHSLFFEKNGESGQYYMSYGKLKAVVVVQRERQKWPSFYQMEIILHVTAPHSDPNIKSNVNEHKDLFKVRAPYDQAFWQSQNQLLLTQEMQRFIKRMSSADNPYSVRGNLD
ncbi:hypothetical protein [Maribacter sp. 2307ULW6-5]|uniref:hypothetical protein n=1 Tax=Maribacter sp. 2307ULW6-5 TaxID=3386275 RepID=UPI0039BD0405